MLPWWEKAKRQQPEVLSRICCGLNHWLCFSSSSAFVEESPLEHNSSASSIAPRICRNKNGTNRQECKGLGTRAMNQPSYVTRSLLNMGSCEKSYLGKCLQMETKKFSVASSKQGSTYLTESGTEE
jgi:hypothetical protein